MKKKEEHKKNVLMNLLLVSASVIVALLIIEIYLRVNWTNYWTSAKRAVILREQVPGDNRKYIRDKRIIKEGGYTIVQTDEDGFLLPNFIKKEGGRLITIAFLGGSTTECFWVKDTLRFPYLSGKMIADSFNISTRILNSAAAGNNSHHSLNILLNKIINYNPDIVIMMHATNDAGILMGTGDYKSAMIEKRKASLVDLLSNNVYSVGFLRHVRAQYIINKQRTEIAMEGIQNITLRDKASLYWDENKLNKALEQFSIRLQIFVDIARDIRATPVLMTMPSYKKLDYELTDEGKRTFLGGLKYLEPFNAKIREVANFKKCKLVDLEKEMERDERYFYDYVHYSDEGSKRIAQIIFKNLKDILTDKLKR